MWSWLPDELLQRIVQLVTERAPRGLAIFVLLDQRSRALAAMRLTRMKPLLTAPFRLNVQLIFSGSGTLDLCDRALRSKDMEVLGLALISGALPKLKSLVLASNSIGDVGVTALATAVGSGALASLQQLWLQKNAIGDAGMSTLASACANGALDSIQSIHLSGNPASQEAKQAVLDAIANRQ